MSFREPSPFAQSFEQLPKTLPIFPLANAVLVPNGKLSLNIFEPRYLEMVADAMQTEHLIGMVQPKPDARHSTEHPSVYELGCAGRITDYSETEDGRLEIILSGLCRFTVLEELPCVRGYRIVVPDWSNFAEDYQQIEEPAESIMAHFKNALKVYLEGREMPADWELLQRLDSNSLVSSLLNVLPIQTSERQILLEADNLENRVRAFTAILNGSISDSQTCH